MCVGLPWCLGHALVGLTGTTLMALLESPWCDGPTAKGSEAALIDRDICIRQVGQAEVYECVKQRFTRAAAALKMRAPEKSGTVFLIHG